MLSIGEFSKICRVSTKTLRYYAEIGLIEPQEVNINSGYRYYSLDQLEKMIFINRLKSYDFSLKEIKEIIVSEEKLDDRLYHALQVKKELFMKESDALQLKTQQLDDDIKTLKSGRSILSYLEDINITLVEVESMNLLAIRKKVHEFDIASEYGQSFGELMSRMQLDQLTPLAPPMVMFHSKEFCSEGLDMEFAIPIKEIVKGTREFKPGLCFKTVLNGPYTELSSVYAKQHEWAVKEGYEASHAIYEVYVTDPSQISNERELVTEVYYPVKIKV